MGILEKLGLAQKSKVGAPSIGEKRKKEREEAANTKRVWFRWLILIGFLALLIYSLPATSFRQIESYTIGEPWRADNLTAPFTFALQKSDQELEQERQEIIDNTAPIFYVDDDIAISVQEEIERVFSELDTVLESTMEQQPDTLMGSAPVDTIESGDAFYNADLPLSESSWRAILENYVTVRTEGRPASEFIGNRLRNQLSTITQTLLANGVISTSKSEMDSREITLRNYQERTERSVNLNVVRDLEEARDFARRQFARNLDHPSHLQIAEELYSAVFHPNWIYNATDTQLTLEEALANISPTKGAIAQGQVIVRKGDIVTEETANMLESLAEARADTASAIERWLRFGGEVIILILTSLFFIFYLYLYRRKIFDNSAMLLLVFLVMGILVLTSGIVYNFENISPYVVPIAIAPLILTIIFDSRVGLMAAVTLAIVTSIYNDNHFEYLIATIMACSFGVFSVRDINKRMQFFVTTPFVVLLGYALVITGFSLTRFGGWESYFNLLMYASVNAIFILFTYPMILFFEKMFGITTDFTLLELGDTNLPLLKELMNSAPGTFHHSLQVANLAESAASAIGANALLCRVGALYHDIGKMTKPGYFIENQSGQNEHDKLKPRMSALVIKAHVSDGVKMAEEHDLPQIVIKCIRTHHGTSLIRYFYERALRQEPEGEVREEDFRYDGPLPDTRETGILMLADGIEAASRSMKDPTYNKLENLINRMVDDSVHEGQLDQCPLTFHQLDIIKKTFLNILLGVYHHRVEYPGSEAEAPKEKSLRPPSRQKRLPPASEETRAETASRSNSASASTPASTSESTSTSAPASASAFRTDSADAADGAGDTVGSDSDADSQETPGNHSGDDASRADATGSHERRP